MDPKFFANTRVRLQRLRDAKLLSGWMRRLTTEQAVVTLKQDAEIADGDEFALQAFGPARVATFRARANARSGDELQLRLTSAIQLLSSKEEMRRAVDGMPSLLLVNGVEYDVSVADLSLNGVAVTGLVDLEKGERVQLFLDSPQGQVVCDCEVVYCRKVEGSDNNRVGLTVKPQNRIDVARWQQLVNLAA